jgi:hypothetical protein
MIIGICGLAGSGKDTAADYLVVRYGFEKISFATIMKEMLAVAGLPEPSNRDDKEKLVEGFPFTWRHAAQTIGTEWGRVCLEEDIWVKLTMNSLDADKDYVVSDVRFDNEATAILAKGGINIKLTDRKVDLHSGAAHISEKGLQENLISATILNSWGLQDLYDELDYYVAIQIHKERILSDTQIS